MHTSYPVLHAQLQHFISQVSQYEELKVAFSGGLDSTVLLHALVNMPACRKKITATYIDHQLQSNSADWGKHCQAICETWSVPFSLVKVTLETKSRQGIEALARKARYQALYQELDPQGVLLTAHHQRDQAETFLLNLTRGSGVAGLAAMPYKKTTLFNHQINHQKNIDHIRPLLNTPYQELQNYAQVHQLKWIEDPSNLDDQFSRNQIRLNVLPQFEQACPFIQKQIERAANHQSEAMALLTRLARQDMKSGECNAYFIDLQSYKALDWTSLKNVLRYWAKNQVNISLSYDQLAWIKEYGKNQQASSASLMMKVGSLRFYRDKLYYVPGLLADYSFFINDLKVLLSTGVEVGIKHAHARYIVNFPQDWLTENMAKLTVRNIRPSDAPHAKRLKKWFQKHGIPIWYRSVWPVICLDDQAFMLWGADAIFDTPVLTVFKNALQACKKPEECVQYVLDEEDVVNLAIKQRK